MEANTNSDIICLVMPINLKFDSVPTIEIFVSSVMGFNVLSVITV